MPKFEVILNHEDRATGFVETSREFVEAETEGEVYDRIFPEPYEGDESEFESRYITHVVSIEEVATCFCGGRIEWVFEEIDESGISELRCLDCHETFDTDQYTEVLE